MGKTVETMTRTAQESTRIMTDYVVQAQELNTRFAQRAFETWIGASRRQTELGQTVAQQLFGNAEQQTDALRNLYGQWVGTLWRFPFPGFPLSGTPYGPRSFQRQGMRLVETATENAQTATETAAGGIEAIAGGNGGGPRRDHGGWDGGGKGGGGGGSSGCGCLGGGGYQKRQTKPRTPP